MLNYDATWLLEDFRVI
uniref:Uncharacterized protein n=1 Tax=Anguilla anguilla TaxID=7936 RepID=A0A0E9QGP4_ANGAN